MLDVPHNGSLRGEGADCLCRNSLADTQLLEHGNTRIPRAYLHMYSTSIISLRSRFPTRVQHITARWEGWCKRRQRVGSRDQQHREKRRVMWGEKQGSAQIIFYLSSTCDCAKSHLDQEHQVTWRGTDRERWKTSKGVGDNILQYENAHIKYIS